MSDLSEEEAGESPNRSGSGRSRSRRPAAEVSRVKIWAAVGGAAPGAAAVRVDPVDHRAVLRAGSSGAERSADVHEGPAHRERGRHVGRSALRDLVVLHPALGRERRITLDGMLLRVLRLFFFQDPLLNYFNTWCTYNTWLFNRGSWSSHIPGLGVARVPRASGRRTTAHQRDRLRHGAVLAIVGCWIMRRIKSRWPNISNLRLILVTYAVAFVADFVMEALFLLPFGLYTYPGAIRAVSMFAGTYHQWPIYEGLMWGGVMTALSCLRFFTDDRGRTVVERGLDQVRGGFADSNSPIPRHLRRCQRVLLLLLQRARPVVRDARRPVARGPSEAFVLQRRHLRRRHRHAVPRSRAADTDEALRLHQHRRQAGTARGRARRCLRRGNESCQRIRSRRTGGGAVLPAVGDEVEVFRAAARRGLPVLLKGPTGCGKTRFVEAMAHELGRELITVAGHEDMTAADLVGGSCSRAGKRYGSTGR